MKYGKTYGIIGALCVFLTVVLALMFIKDWRGLTGAALFFMILSEAVLFGGLIFIDLIAGKTSQILSRAGIGNVIAAYSVMTFLSSLLFMTFFKDSIKRFAAIQIILIVAAIIAGILFYTVSAGRKEKDRRVMDAVSFVKDSVERLNTVCNAMPDDANKKMLRKVAEDLNYTDCSLNVHVDSELEDSIADLELANVAGKDGMEIEAIIKKLNQLITTRKTQTRLAKRGGI